MKAKDFYGVLIHGKKSGIFLEGEWAVRWKEQGYRKECGNKNTAVKIDGCKFIATYQPLWNGDPEEFDEYREELQQMLIYKGKTVVGGDFNSSVGDIREREVPGTAGPHGLAKTNVAGRNLLNWCASEGLAWVNFFREQKRGTWCHPATEQWHELDGFLVKQKEQSRWLRALKMLHLDQRLTDHQPKQLIANLCFERNRKIRGQLKSTGTGCKMRTAIAFRQKTDEMFTEASEHLPWTDLMAIVEKAGKACCGTKEKQNLNPWLENH